MTDSATDIVKRSDAGQHPDAIADALGLTVGRVYAVLREERPKRKRKPRTRTSALRGKILALKATGADAARVVHLLEGECARQYVYRIFGEAASK